MELSIENQQLRVFFKQANFEHDFYGNSHIHDMPISALF